MARYELSADDVQADACGMGQSIVFRVNTEFTTQMGHVPLS